MEKYSSPSRTSMVDDKGTGPQQSHVIEEKQDDKTREEEQYITGMKLYTLMASLVLCFFLTALDMSIVAAAIPYITGQFHSLEDVGWYGSAYQLACASLFPLAGKLYANFKSKHIYLTYFAIFELGSLLCGVATSSRMLIIGRAVAGIGTSGLMNGGLTIASASIPLHKRPKYFGVMMGVSKMGVVCGPLLGGAFTSYVSWRWCFYTNLPIGAIAFAVLWSVDIPQTAKPRTLPIIEIIRTKLDLIGFVIFAATAIQFFLALDYGGDEYPWDSPMVIGLFCGAGGSAIIFMLWEWYQKDNAMIPLSMIRLRPVWSSCIVMVLMLGCLQTAVYYLPIYFQTVKEASPILSGVYLLPSIISQLVFGVLTGIGMTKLGYYLPFTLLSATLLSISTGLLSTLSLHTPTATWIGYQILLGLAQGLGIQGPFIAVQNIIAPSMIPIAMAMLSFSQTFGGAIYLAVDNTILTNGLARNVPVYAPGVEVEAVIRAGASAEEVLRVVGGDRGRLRAVLGAYARSVDCVFYLAVGSAGLMFFVAWGMGMKSIRKKDGKGEEDRKEGV